MITGRSPVRRIVAKPRQPARLHRANAASAMRRGRWPGPTQRLMLLGGILGSMVGLFWGFGSLNRPLVNGLVFYLVGFGVGVLCGAVTGLVITVVGGPRRAGHDQ